RRRVIPGSVRQLLWYYATVRLPRGVRAGGTVIDLLRPTRRTTGGDPRGLPFPLRRGFTPAQGLRPRRVPGRPAPVAAVGVAFRLAQRRRRPGGPDFAARWLAHVCPCQRFAGALTVADA